MTSQPPTGKSLLNDLLSAAEGIVEDLAPKKRQGAEIIVICGGQGCQQKLRLKVKTLFSNHQLTMRCPKCKSLTAWQLTSTVTPAAD